MHADLGDIRKHCYARERVRPPNRAYPGLRIMLSVTELGPHMFTSALGEALERH